MRIKGARERGEGRREVQNEYIAKREKRDAEIRKAIMRMIEREGDQERKKWQERERGKSS